MKQRLFNTALLLLVPAALALGCGDSREGSGAPAASGAPSATSKSAATATSAAAAAAKPADKAAWVKLADSIDIQITDKMDGDKNTGTITNKGEFPVAAVNFWMYVYDKDGKQLERVKGEKSFGEPLAPGKSADVKVGPLKEAKAGTTIQAVVSWMRLPEGTMWQDSGRAPDQRPMVK